VLAIDSFGPRGIGDTYADNARLNLYAQARDALAARRYLVSIGYQADRMAVMGLTDSRRSLPPRAELRAPPS
jgi:hypothetical protein